MDRSDVYRQVAGLHAESISGGFLSQLGPGFLALMYRAIDEAPGSALFVEFQDGRAVGFVSGATGMGSIYRRMLRWPVRLAVAVAPSLVRPRQLRKIFDIIKYARVKPSDAAWPHAELLSIAVAVESRGTGVSGRLYRRLAAHFDSQGHPTFRIVVGDALEPAHRFYRRMGATPVGRVEVHPGEASTVYIHQPDLSLEAPSE